MKDEGLPYGVRTHTHIAVDLFIRKLSKTPRRVVDAIAIIICLIYAGLMLYGSAIFVERLFALGNYARDVPAPKWLLTVTMPLGFTLLAYRFLEAGWQVLRGHDAVEEEA